MTKEELAVLIKYIDAVAMEKAADALGRDSLSDSILRIRYQEELENLATL